MASTGGGRDSGIGQPCGPGDPANSGYGCTSFRVCLGPEVSEPAAKASLTSVGIDLGAKLSSWNTQLVEVLWFELNDSGTERPFLVTERIPEHGRSGGGIFDKSGTLVGVCVGHAELVKGKRMGVFSSVENVRQLLREHELTSLIERSEARQARLARNADASAASSHTPIKIRGHADRGHARSRHPPPLTRAWPMVRGRSNQTIGPKPLAHGVLSGFSDGAVSSTGA